MRVVEDDAAREGVPSLDPAAAPDREHFTPSDVGQERESSPAVPEAADGVKLPAAESAVRLASLDAFRGLTIVGMLLVNNVALGQYTPRQLTHAPWNGGVYFADLVFPWFLFIVGVAVPYSAASFRRKGLSYGRYALKVVGRAFSLFLLGCLVDSSVARQPVLGLGVLQLIGLAYAGAALLSPLPPTARGIIAGALLVGHWAAIRFIPVPGVGAGVFEEQRNLIQHLNQVHLAPLGLKGLVSAIPTTAMTLIGTLVADCLRNGRLAPGRKVGILLGVGLALAALGWAWSHDLPFNKPVWTASYIVYTAGLGCLTLGLLYLVMDVGGWKGWASPFVVFGSNAIVAYVAPILVKVHVLQEWARPGSDPRESLQEALLRTAIEHYGRVNGGWVYTAGYILAWWLVLLVLYRKRWLLRV